MSITEIFAENITKLINLNGYLPLPLLFFFFPQFERSAVLYGKKAATSVFLLRSYGHPQLDQQNTESVMDGKGEENLPLQSDAATPLLLLSEASGNALLRSWVLH